MNKKSIFKIQSKYLNVTNNKKQLKAIKNLEHWSMKDSTFVHDI